ncbi:MAG TPA: cbb3-type cytochrome oxidase assembly protein CcoS [Kofleriaceae bacterium]|nr:cbb3-type cytochrome oxidase assembly protein CcoS [Kofleriaceae bacterium]
MIVLYLILPLALVFASGAVAAFAWTVRTGQLDDVDTPPRRILFDDERAMPAREAVSPALAAQPALDPAHSGWHAS